MAIKFLRYMIKKCNFFYVSSCMLYPYQNRFTYQVLCPIFLVFEVLYYILYSPFIYIHGSFTSFSTMDQVPHDCISIFYLSLSFFSLTSIMEEYDVTCLKEILSKRRIKVRSLRYFVFTDTEK